jgi:hypothetical protein
MKPAIGHVRGTPQEVACREVRHEHRDAAIRDAQQLCPLASEAEGRVGWVVWHS